MWCGVMCCAFLYVALQRSRRIHRWTQPQVPRAGAEEPWRAGGKRGAPSSWAVVACQGCMHGGRQQSHSLAQLQTCVLSDLRKMPQYLLALSESLA